MSGKSGVKTLRMLRVVDGVLLIVNAAFAVVLAFAGHFAVSNVAAVALLVLVMCSQTFVIRRQRRLGRACPDYAAIARMEREVYGEASEEVEVMFAHAKLQGEDREHRTDPEAMTGQQVKNIATDAACLCADVNQWIARAIRLALD